MSGASGDGCSADSGGEGPREGENQEGIGLNAYLNRGVEARIPAGRSPEGGLLGHSRGLMNLEDVRVR